MEDYEKLNATEKAAINEIITRRCGFWGADGGLRKFAGSLLAYAAEHGYKPPAPPKCGMRHPKLGGNCLLDANHPGDHKRTYMASHEYEDTYIVWPNYDAQHDEAAS